MLVPYTEAEYKERLMGLSDDRSKVDTTLQPNGQQRDYLILSDAERAKGFKRPPRYMYVHKKCGGTTSMGNKLSETYARDPDFYCGTFCAVCGTHFNFKKPDGDENPDGVFYWKDIPETDATAQLGFERY
jgi:hypothetical protein